MLNEYLYKVLTICCKSHEILGNKKRIKFLLTCAICWIKIQLLNFERFTNMLSAAFSIGASGLTTMNRVVDTVSNNLANANTPYFSRSDRTMSDLQFGGVTSRESFRFSATSLERMASSEGAFTFQNTQSAYLSNIQEGLSATSDQIGNISSDYKKAVGNLLISTDTSTAQTVISAQGKSMAVLLNSQYKELQNSLTDAKDSVAFNVTKANGVAKQIAQLNKEVTLSGAESATTNKLAQLSQEYAGLTGATIKFEQNGMVTATVNGSQTVVGDQAKDITDTMGVGGSIGGVTAASVKISGYMADLDKKVNDYTSTMNTANGGTALFSGSLATGDFAYTSASVGVNVANDVLNVKSLDSGIGTLAGMAALDAESASDTAEYQNTLLENQKSSWQAQYGVDVDQETLKMKEAQRAYEANAKVIATADSMLGTLLAIKS